MGISIRRAVVLVAASMAIGCATATCGSQDGGVQSTGSTVVEVPYRLLDETETWKNGSIEMIGDPSLASSTGVLTAAAAYSRYESSPVFPMFGAVGYPTPSLILGRYSNHEYGEAHEDGTVTPIYIDKPAWFVYYKDVEWRNTTPGGAYASAAEGADLPTVGTGIDESSRGHPADILVALDAISGELYNALTFPSESRDADPKAN